MTERISRLREYIVAHEHRKFRRPDPISPDGYRDSSIPLHRRDALRLAAHLAAEKPIILADESIVLTRTLPDAPDILSDDELAQIKAGHFIHERGYVFNLTPDYDYVISRGLDELMRELDKSRDAHPDKSEWLESVKIACRAVIELADSYRRSALEAGREDIAEVFEVIPRKPAQTLRQALQFLRLLHFALWCEGLYHVGLGRFDQTFYSYYKHDIDAGILTRSGALELVEDFFLSCNKDSDLYPGMQQGDNGQSLTIGGYDINGGDMFNELSDIVLDASLELKVIDPKLNLRVSTKTPYERYEKASRLTAAGLGFPQYCNDDIVVDGFIRHGYDKRDAVDYTVAACWEFIIPKRGFDIPNIDALSFVKCVDNATRGSLAECKDFDSYLRAVESEITKASKALTSRHGNIFIRPAVFASIMGEGCISSARDISEGLKYNNYGIHGTGVASAADYIAAVKQLIFDEKKLDASALIKALDSDFSGYDELYNYVCAAPKMGNDIDEVDSIAESLLHTFAEALKGIKNERGGIYRAGTGSAMYYAAHAAELGAGADGRHKGAYLPANYSPSLGIKLNGPMSIVNSFTKPELSEVFNGGPLTLEFAATAVRDDAGISKLALLVQSFVRRGGLQLQLNVIDKKSLLDAQLHPEKYKNLVVRVWGWSGYFTELDKIYQEQIIKRADLVI